jgi:hypothetical protein
MRPSQLQLTSIVPSRLKWTPLTESECAGRVRWMVAVRTIQRWMHSSFEPEARRDVWGLKERAVMGAV